MTFGCLNVLNFSVNSSKTEPNWADNSVISLFTFHGEMWMIHVFSTKLPNRSEKFSELLLDFVVITFFTPLHHYFAFIFEPNFFLTQLTYGDLYSFKNNNLYYCF